MRDFMDHSASNWMTSVAGLCLGVPHCWHAFEGMRAEPATGIAWGVLCVGLALCVLGLSARDYFGKG